MERRRYGQTDRFIIEFDKLLAGVFARVPEPQRPSPAADCAAVKLSEAERRISSGLMRVNHAGEVSAQALYQGQSMTAHTGQLREAMRQAAAEELDHLHWCRLRLDELGTHSSLLNPVWYCGSFTIGALAGLLGDRWSLGFLAETENQVVRHLESHLQKLPVKDASSRVVLEQMKTDEARHACSAVQSGAVELPPGIRKIMQLCSRLMTGTAYWI